MRWSEESGNALTESTRLMIFPIMLKILIGLKGGKLGSARLSITKIGTALPWRPTD